MRDGLFFGVYHCISVSNHKSTEPTITRGIKKNRTRHKRSVTDSVSGCFASAFGFTPSGKQLPVQVTSWRQPRKSNWSGSMKMACKHAWLQTTLQSSEMVIQVPDGQLHRYITSKTERIPPANHGSMANID